MIGRQILHYEIRERLGGGGSGEVYLARDLRLDRDVAIKRVVSELRLDSDRIGREAKVLAALSHPNIVTVHAVESDGMDQLLVMELVGGTPLTSLMSPDGLDPELILRWGSQIARGVAAAHEAGVLHRDLKPDNILVTDEGLVKILDFGLAEAGDDTAEDEDETISRIASITGTVAYLAPELILGRRATTLTDVFAVGVVLYEMATGRRPFQASSSVELLAAIVNEPIAQVQRLVPGFPRSLARWIEKSLAKIPEERPQSAGELADALERLHVRSLSGSERHVRRGLTLTAVALMGVLGWWLGSGTGRSGQPLVEPPPAVVTERQRVAVLPFLNQGPTESAYFAAGVTEEVTGRLASVAGLKVLSSTSVARYSETSLPTKQIGEELGVDYLLEGTVQWDTSAPERGRVRVSTRLVKVADESLAWSGRYDRVLEDIFSVQTEIAEAVIDQMGVVLFPQEQRALRYRPTSDLAAYQAYLQAIDSRHKPLGDDLDRPIRLLEEAVRRDPQFTLAWAELAHAHAKLHHYGHDRSAERRAMARRAIDRALELDPESPEVHLANGYVYYWAERNYSKALEELAAAAPNLPNNARLFAAQAFILRRLGRFRESLAKHAQARDLDPLADHHDRAMAVSEYYLRQYDQARDHLARAVELAPDEIFNRMLQVQLAWLEGDLTAARAVLDGLRAEAGDRPLTPQVLGQLLHQMSYEGQSREALELLAAAEVDVFRWTVRLHPKALAQAEYAYLSGLFEQERVFAAQALQWIDEALVENPQDARLHGARGLALASLGRDQEATAAADEGIRLLPMEDDALNAPSRLIEAARIYSRLGRHDRAIDLLRELFSQPCEYSVAWLRLDPWFADIVRHPRFQELVAAEDSSR